MRDRTTLAILAVLMVLVIFLALAAVLWAAQERHAPDAVLTQTNLTGALADIDDDPDSPDAAWLTQTSGGTDTILRVSFATPTDTLTTGAGLQEFKIHVRSGQNSGFSGNGTENYDLFLYEAGSEVAMLASAIELGDALPQTDAYQWDASLLADGTGADVELRLFGRVAAGGGAPGSRAAVEVGAVEWNAEVGEAAAPSRRVIVVGAEP